MFDVDLATWEKYEYEFMRKLLKPWVAGVHKPPKEKRKNRDIKVDYEDWTSKTYEIKSCPRAKEYWSIPIEYECNWQPSWPFASKADYIVYYMDDQFYVQDRWIFLAELALVNKYTTVWWDNEKSKMFIVNLETAKVCLFK
jgi:hypothetical protein